MLQCSTVGGERAEERRGDLQSLGIFRLTFVSEIGFPLSGFASTLYTVYSVTELVSTSIDIVG